jgi:hypothetical protein
MDRRLVITISYLVLALAALAMAGLFGSAGAPAAAGVPNLPQPAPCPLAELPQALSTVPADGAVATASLPPTGMSGDFAKRLLADAGALRAPSIFVPSDHWRPGMPRTHGAFRLARPQLCV